MKIANIFSSLAKRQNTQQDSSDSELKKEMTSVRRKAGLGATYDNRSALIIQAYEDRETGSCDDCSFGYSEKIEDYAILFPTTMLRKFKKRSKAQKMSLT